MPISLRRALLAVLAIDVIAFVVAYAERHAQHGFGAGLGAVGWFTFLGSSGVALLLAAGAATAVTVQRLRRTSL